MTEKQKRFRNNLLTKIHAHSFYKGAYESGAWEEFLENNFGVKSSRYLSIKELISVISLMDGGKISSKEPDWVGRRAINNEISTKKQIVKALALKDELGWKKWEFRAFVLKHTDKMLWNDEMINSLSKQNLTKLISVMSKIKTWKDKR